MDEQKSVFDILVGGKFPGIKGPTLDSSTRFELSLRSGENSGVVTYSKPGTAIEWFGLGYNPSDVAGVDSVVDKLAGTKIDQQLHKSLPIIVGGSASISTTDIDGDGVPDPKLGLRLGAGTEKINIYVEIDVVSTNRAVADVVQSIKEVTSDPTGMTRVANRIREEFPSLTDEQIEQVISNELKSAIENPATVGFSPIHEVEMRLLYWDDYPSRLDLKALAEIHASEIGHYDVNGNFQFVDPYADVGPPYEANHEDYEDYAKPIADFLLRTKVQALGGEFEPDGGYSYPQRDDDGNLTGATVYVGADGSAQGTVFPGSNGGTSGGSSGNTGGSGGGSGGTSGGGGGSSSGGWNGPSDSTGAGGRSSNGGNGWSTNDGRPVVLDLDGDGVEVTFGEQTFFDWDDDGFLEQGSWASADDGFLVLDLNADGTRGVGDGQIDQTRELVLSLWGSEGMTDLQALAQAHDADGNLLFDTWVDTNNNGLRDTTTVIDPNTGEEVERYTEFGDGVLNSDDAVWHELRIWQDVDQDGETDQGELFVLGGVEASAWYDTNGDDIEQADEWHVLEEATAEVWNDLNGDTVRDEDEVTYEAITEINLTYDDGSGYEETDDDIEVFGNTLHGLASFSTANGGIVEGGVGDVALYHASLGWRQVSTALGYAIEFETGESYHYAILDGTGDADIDLDTHVLDGATGDARDNVLDATGHTRIVSISGGLGDDTVIGGVNDDLLAGDEGADSIFGGGGNDVLFVDAADFASGFVDGGAGIDFAVITGDLGASVTLLDHKLEGITGAEGHDNLSGVGLSDDLSIQGQGGNDTIRGGEGNDVLSGGDGDDSLIGRDGDDILTGSSGLDTIFGGDGDDLLLGGHDADQLSGNAGDDVLLGDRGDDMIDGGGGDDRLDGGAGNDTLIVGSGDDIVDAGAGNDELHFHRGDNILVGGDGDDSFCFSSVVNGIGHFGRSILQGGTGQDVLFLDTNEVNFLRHISGNQWQLHYRQDDGSNTLLDILDVEEVRFANGTLQVLSSDVGLDTGDDYVRADDAGTYMGEDTEVLVNIMNTDGDRIVERRLGAGNDTLSGWIGNASDLIFGATGNDQIRGGAGNDELSGGSGADAVFGDSGHDLIEGFGGSDILVGGDGRDSIDGGSGADQIWGNSGDDSIQGKTGSDVISGGDGFDTIHGGTGADLLYGDNGADSLFGGVGSDLLSGNAGYDTLDGEDGADTLIGGGGNDSLIGGDGLDALYGDAGHDILDGGQDDDFLFGGEGDDSLHGNAANDFLQGGAGADTLDGGTGNFDFASYEGATDDISVSLLTGLGVGGDAEGDILISIENLIGGEGWDTLIGDDKDNVIYGGYGGDFIESHGGNDAIYVGGRYDTVHAGDGDDRVWGGDGRDLIHLDAGDDSFFDSELNDEHGGDWVYGGDGNDEIFGGGGNDEFHGEKGDDTITGGIGDDLIHGGNDADHLSGDVGNDTLNGGTGTDTLAGGHGNDVLAGGADGDVFVFEGEFGGDTITDFIVSDTAEVIDLRGVSSITDFADLISNHISELAGDAIINDGNGNQITLTGVALGSLTEDEFLFT